MSSISARTSDNRPPISWRRVPVAVWRLARVAVHVVAGVWEANTSWSNYDAARKRRETIRWSSRLLTLLGVRVQQHGVATPGGKLIVANHVSWLDIVVINSTEPARFVSKAEVGRWPIVGRLVDAAGTLYLVRERRRDAARVLGLMSDALRQGNTVAVFPEGTTGSGHGVLPFHPNLFQAAIDAESDLQPVALRYEDAYSPVSNATQYVGETTLLQSLWMVATARDICVHVHMLPAISAKNAERRLLAEQVQSQVLASLAE